MVSSTGALTRARKYQSAPVDSAAPEEAPRIEPQTKADLVKQTDTLTQETALDFVFSWDGTANGRAIRYGVVRRFAEYLAIYDPQTAALDPRALPRSSDTRRMSSSSLSSVSRISLSESTTASARARLEAMRASMANGHEFYFLGRGWTDEE